MVAGPPPVVTPMANGPPAECAGVTAVNAVGLTDVTLSSGTPPTVAPVTKPRLVPVTVIVVPPWVEPLDGLTELMDGATATVYGVIVPEISGLVPAELPA